MFFIKVDNFRCTRLLRTSTIKLVVFAKLFLRFSIFFPILLDCYLNLITLCPIFFSSSCNFVTFIFQLLLLLADDLHSTLHFIKLFFTLLKLLVTVFLYFLTRLHLQQKLLPGFVVFLDV